MICRCYRCEKAIHGVGKWVPIKIGRVSSEAFVCPECAKVMIHGNDNRFHPADNPQSS